MKNQPGTIKNHENRYGTMKNQPGTIKTNLELDRVTGGSGGYRRLTVGSDDFLLQTYRQTDTSPLYIYHHRHHLRHHHCRNGGRGWHWHNAHCSSPFGSCLPLGVNLVV